MFYNRVTDYSIKKENETIIINWSGDKRDVKIIFTKKIFLIGLKVTLMCISCGYCLCIEWGKYSDLTFLPFFPLPFFFFCVTSESESSLSSLAGPEDTQQPYHWLNTQKSTYTWRLTFTLLSLFVFICRGLKHGRCAWAAGLLLCFAGFGFGLALIFALRFNGCHVISSNIRHTDKTPVHVNEKHLISPFFLLLVSGLSPFIWNIEAGSFFLTLDLPLASVSSLTSSSKHNVMQLWVMKAHVTGLKKPVCHL